MGDDTLGLGPEWYSTTPETTAAAPSDGGSNATGSSDEPPRDVPPDDSFYDHYDDGGGWDDSQAPPPSYDEPEPWADTAPAASPQGKAGGWDVSYRRRRLPDAGADGEPEQVRKVLRRVLASLDGEPAEAVMATVSRISREKDVVDRAPEDWRPVLEGVLEVLSFECTALGGVGKVDFSFLPAARNHSAGVGDEIELLYQMAHPGTGEAADLSANPAGEFEALVENIAAGISRQAALILVRAVDDKVTAARKMSAFRDIPPPTRQGEVVNNDWARTAEEWEDVRVAAEGSGLDLILSSGKPSLDMAASGSSGIPGLIKPGEFWVVGAGTGHGKSAFTRPTLTAMLLDLTRGWGIRDGLGILGFTEEEAWDVTEAAGMKKGQPFHFLARNAVLAKLGQSRRRAITVVYDTVIAAVKKAESTGAPITEFLPYLYMLDYIQAIAEPGENPDTEGVSRTADLMMRGVAAWDPEMMGAISGVDFQEYSGMRWPSGMENHRVAVICLSQLRKEGNDHNVFFRSGRSTVSDFTVTDANGMPMWDPLEDDYAIPNRSDLRGSGVLLNHATGLIFLHRSRPTASVRKDPATGKVVGLTDTRSRFIVPKARKSVSMPYIPMRFDSNPEGFRGMFYDDLAYQHCVVEGRMEIQREWCQREGDPILPKRPARSPWSLRY